MTSATYTHDLLRSPSHIRLLELLPDDSSRHVSILVHQVQLLDDGDDSALDATPAYTALSYTWGPDVERDKSPVWLDGESFLVRPNLLAALQNLRRTDESLVLWIDAICINQDNIEERNTQVGRMGRIYYAAKKVIIWLGMGSVDIVTAMRYISTCNDEASQATEATEAVPVRAIETLLKHEYWSRVWIIQEVMLAAEIDVYLGTSVITWDKLMQVCQSMCHRLSHLPSIDLIEQRVALTKKQRPLLAQTLESLIRTYHTAQCSERRDRIFALISLASDCASGQGLKPDYQVPRLALLVHVLEFCRPDDPIDFISKLFSALTYESNDEAWEKAVRHWIDSSRDLTVLNPLSAAERSTNRNIAAVQITHFITASSTTKNWVRVYTFLAALDQGVINHGPDVSQSSFARMIRHRIVGAEPYCYRNLVGKLDKTQIAVLLHKFHYVVFSTTPAMTAISPCNGLGLHAESPSCDFASCGMIVVI